MQPAAQPTSIPTSSAQIEITLENGLSDGFDAGFVLELARGLAACSLFCMIPVLADAKIWLAAGVTDMRPKPSKFWRAIHTQVICFCFKNLEGIKSR